MLYKDLGLVYVEDFHETFSHGFKCIVSSVRASNLYDSNTPSLSEETHRVTSIFAGRLKEVCCELSKEDFRKEVIVFSHSVNGGKFSSEQWPRLVNL